MRDPKRILIKLLGDPAKGDACEATGEPLELVVEVLRDIVKCRKSLRWLKENHGLDLAVSPAAFEQLLDIPAINHVETTDRNLDVKIDSLKELRSPGDPVTIANLNAVLRELYRSLHEIRERRKKELPTPLLMQAIDAERLKEAEALVAALRACNGRRTGYLFTAFKARTKEKRFEALFPGATEAHPLRQHLDRVEAELSFYKRCVETERTWRPVGLDVLRLLREDGLPLVMQNIEEVGNQLWNIVYKNPGVRRSIELTGIDFADVRPLLDDAQVPVKNV